LQSKLEPANPIKLILTSEKETDREKEAPLALVVIDREEKTSEFLKEVKQDKQSNLPGEDWRDAVVVVWTLVLTVAVKRTTSVIDDGKIKKIRGKGCCGG